MLDSGPCGRCYDHAGTLQFPLPSEDSPSTLAQVSSNRPGKYDLHMPLMGCNLPSVQTTKPMLLVTHFAHVSESPYRAPPALQHRSRSLTLSEAWTPAQRSPVARAHDALMNTECK